MISAEITEDWLDAGSEMMKVWSAQSFGWMRGAIAEEAPSSLLPPHLDDLMGVSVKMTALMSAATELSRESVKYQVRLLPGYCEIGLGYARSLQSSDKKVFASFRLALQDWLDYANKELVRLSNSDEILQQHNSFSEALSKYRKCNQVMVDSVLEKLDMPTQREVETIGRSLAEMKRELRKLRQISNALSSTQDAVESDVNIGYVPDAELQTGKLRVLPQ